MGYYGNKEYRHENNELYSWIEVDENFLAELVPSNFLFRSSDDIIWRYYVHWIKTKNNKYYIKCGSKYDFEDRRIKRLSDEEYQIYLDHFPSKDFLKWNQYKNLIEKK